MKILSCRVLLVIALAYSINTSVLAQYVWLDENGHKQYSDQAPPPSVPKNRILKFNSKSADDPSLLSTPNTTTTPDVKAKQPENLADKELAYKKRQQELMEKAKKEEAESKATAVRNENCKRMKEYKQSLESGMRVSEMNANGTTSYMTEEKRAQEIKEATQNMSECK
jgi:type IV secretory pathway VirB10-like protein